MKLIDLTGEKFGKLEVLEQASNSKNGRVRWLCRCDCGNKIIVCSNHLKSGHTKSCGCLHIKHGHAQTGKVSEIYSSWQHMKQRCTNPNHKHYKYYGGRGITVCGKWLIFENFDKDMRKDWQPGLTLERKDKNGNYCPENCEWATRKEQQRNRRNNRLETYNGKTQCRSAWAEEFDINYKTLEGRLNSGWSIERALMTPVRQRRKKSK